jgi:hypothetical protein
MVEKISGRVLNKKWKIGARHALYHYKGDWYEHLTDFPGALCDPNGYIIFASKEQYQNCPRLQLGVKVHVPNGIASIPGYTRVQNSS